jgi:hypothetical protein
VLRRAADDRIALEAFVGISSVMNGDLPTSPSSIPVIRRTSSDGF